MSSPNELAADESPPIFEVRLEGVALDESSVARSPVLPYVRMMVSLIEGVAFRGHQIVRLLGRALRQHSIGAPGRTGYAWGFPPQRPP